MATSTMWTIWLLFRMKYSCGQFQQFSHCKLNPRRQANQGFIREWADWAWNSDKRPTELGAAIALKGQVLPMGTEVVSSLPEAPSPRDRGGHQCWLFSLELHWAMLVPLKNVCPVGHRCLPSGQKACFPYSFIFGLPISGSIVFWKTCHVFPFSTIIHLICSFATFWISIITVTY